LQTNRTKNTSRSHFRKLVVRGAIAFSLINESVAEVILGYRMASDIRKTITTVVREKYQKAVLYQTALNEVEYDLDVNPNSD
jgi:hypothetical protein